MESPINPTVWKVLFNGTIAALSTAAFISLYHERYRTLSSLRDEFRNIRESKNNTESTTALYSLLLKLKEDTTAKRGISRLAAQREGLLLMRFIQLNSDGDNSESVSVALQCIVRIFSFNNEGPYYLNKYNGYYLLMRLLSDTHRLGLIQLAEETARCIATLTCVNDSDVILENDIPKGSDGAVVISQMSSVNKMLRVLDPTASPLFLCALTEIFANICALRIGAISIGKGTGGRSGISFFIALLDHNNINLVANCILTVRYMARVNIGHDEISQEENIIKIANNFSSSGDPRIINSILTIILVMFDSPHGPNFFNNLINKTGMMRSMFEIWCHASDKTLRDRSRLLVQLIARVPLCENTVQSFLEKYRVQIAERRNKDEEELRRQNMQQMRQQQMMQQMMLGGLGGMDMADLMGE